MSRAARHHRWLPLALSLAAGASLGCSKKSSCFDGWKVIYRSAQGEEAPTWGDLAWRNGTLFVAHSDTANSFFFSIPDHGGAKTSLANGLRHFWLDGDNVIFVEEAANALDSVPAGGGTPTQIVQYGLESDPSGQLLAPMVLDGSAFYWTFFEISGQQEVLRHFRGGGGDTDLGLMPMTTLGYAPAFAGQSQGQLVLGYTNDNAGAAVVTVPKAGGTPPVLLPVPNPTRSTPLAVSIGGALLYSQGTQDASDPNGVPITHYDLLLGQVDGTLPAAFSTTLPRTVAATVGWSTANGAWVVAGNETDGLGDRLHSIWNVAADGSARELACHEAVGPDASTLAVNPSRITAGVVADGVVFVSLAFMDGSWQIARVDSTGSAPDVGDAGMPLPDGSFDVPPAAACLPGAPVLGTGAAAHTIQEIPVPSTESGPGQIALGSDGNLWFTEVQTSKLGRVTPTGCVTEFSLNDRAAEGLTAGPDGALWFTQPGEPQIGRMTTSGVLQEFTLPAAAENPDQIVAGSDGSLWFTDPLAGAVGRMTIGGVGTEYPTPTKLSNPIGIAAGSDGLLWVVESGRNIIAHVDPSSGVITELPVLNASLGPIASGPDGNIWFEQSQNSTEYFVQLEPDGTMTPFPLPAGVFAAAIVSGPDGNLWFADSTNNAIGQMALSTHAVTEFTVPTANSDTFSLAVGPDGNIWFVENAGNQIGQLKL